MSDKRHHSPKLSPHSPQTIHRPKASNASHHFEPVDDRLTGRYLMGGAVTCNAGKLVNLSTEGALVVSRTPLGATVPFMVSDGACRVACSAKVLRTRCLGPHRHSCALQFDSLRPEEVAAIEHMIARHHIPHAALRDAA
ncbi:MAG: PilZ domain-containing protein [Phycisphaerae bacterium]|jgi:hypothetical protein|nr:PilZ domain-containing protein [Phycisphaerae bacterium]